MKRLQRRPADRDALCPRPLRRWRRLIFLGLCWACLPIRSGGAETTLYVENTFANLRATPTAAEPNIVARVAEKTAVTVLERQGVWYRVRLADGREGWLSKLLLRDWETFEANEPSAPPVVTGAPDEASAAAADAASMILIPAGSFVIGSTESEIQQLAGRWDVALEALQDEVPQRRVTLDAFYIDQYEVTNAAYLQFVATTGYPPPIDWENGRYPSGTAKHPVTFVSLDDALAYAQWAGKRLPTAEEWEAAARGPRGQIFPWGASLDAQRVNLNRATAGIGAIGSFPDDRSAFDVYDLGGNVTEWTMTQYAAQKDFFVLKGGAWNSGVLDARGAHQTPGEAMYQLSHIGFRCAKSAGR